MRPGQTFVHLLKCFLTDERGQDLVEYALLVTFVTLAGGGIFAIATDSVGGIWRVANDEVSRANAALH